MSYTDEVTELRRRLAVMESLLRDAIVVLGEISAYEGAFPGADHKKEAEIDRLFAAFPDWEWGDGPKPPS